MALERNVGSLRYDDLCVGYLLVVCYLYELSK
jgi:hypothetical protein